MDDSGMQDDKLVDFLMPESGQTGEASNFRVERPAAGVIASSSESKPHIVPPQPDVISDQLRAVRGELANLNGETEQKSGSTVLVFGQGPVISEPEERVNYWSKDLAHAAAVLKKYDPNINDFVVMGGRTGGPDFSSEASLIASEMHSLGIDQEAITAEEMSDDTIQNIVNFLNIFDSKGNIDEQKFDILCAPYHTARTQVLMQLFKVPVGHVFQSTEVLRYVARIPKNGEGQSLDSAEWDHASLQAIEDRVNINDPTKYSSKQSEQERQDVADRYVKDDIWTRELLEYPEKWLPYVGTLHNGERIKAILTQFEDLFPGRLEEKYGITVPENTDEASLVDIKEKLAKIPKYEGLSDETVSQWAADNKKQDWPEKTNKVLQKLLVTRHGSIT